MMSVNLLENGRRRRRLPRLRKGLIFATIIVIVCAFVGARMIRPRSTAQANSNKPAVTSKKPVKQSGKKPTAKKKARHARTK